MVKYVYLVFYFVFDETNTLAFIVNIYIYIKYLFLCMDEIKCQTIYNLNLLNIWLNIAFITEQLFLHHRDAVLVLN